MYFKCILSKQMTKGNNVRNGNLFSYVLRKNSKFAQRIRRRKSSFTPFSGIAMHTKYSILSRHQFNLIQLPDFLFEKSLLIRVQ